MLTLRSAPLNRHVRRELTELSNGLIRTEPLTHGSLARELAAGRVPDTTRKKKLTGELADNFQPRSAGDLAIRRLKLNQLQIPPDLHEVLAYLTHLDLIFVSNLTLWALAWGTDKLIALKRLGYLNSDIQWVTSTKKLSSALKRYAGANDLKQPYVEAESLLGYQLTDLEPVNWVQELKDLAHGGDDHGMGDGWDKLFARTFDVIAQPSRRPVEWLSLREYIDKGWWATSGASSIGDVHWEYDKDKGKFRARKNMLTSLYTTDELYDLVISWDGRFRNKAFTKDELSKRRLAVSANLEAYILESYLLYLTGKPYTEWEGIALEESSDDWMLRTFDVTQLLKQGAWALPFDFKAFDHQPTTAEVVCIVSKVTSLVKVPPSFASEVEALRRKVIGAYQHSSIEMKIDNRMYKEQVSGGLPSGVRFTSVIGNAWNATMTQIAADIAGQIVGKTTFLRRGFLGDDTYILSFSPVDLYLFRLAYQAINAVGLDSKFGITQSTCEFLRVEISGTGAIGWSNRILPTITQRKPWNPQPWSPSASISTTWDNLTTWERRSGMQLMPVRQAIKRWWSRLTGQSSKWLQLPRMMGGLGLEPWQGLVPNSGLPLVKLPRMDFADVKPKWLPEWISLTADQQQDLAQTQMRQTVAADDVVGPQKHFGRQWLREVRLLSVSWHTVDRLSPRSISTPLLPNADNARHLPKIKTTKWPRAGEVSVTEFIRQWNVVSQAVNIPSMMTFLEAMYPGFAEQVKQLEKNGWHRTNAIDLALGHPTIEPFKHQNTQLSSVVAQAVLDNRPWHWKGRDNIAKLTCHICNTVESQIAQSQLGALYRY